MAVPAMIDNRGLRRHSCRRTTTAAAMSSAAPNICSAVILDSAKTPIQYTKSIAMAAGESTRPMYPITAGGCLPEPKRMNGMARSRMVTPPVTATRASI